MAAQALRVVRGELHRKPSAERLAREVHPVEPERVEQAEKVLLVLRDLEVVIRQRRVAVTRIVVADHPEASLGERSDVLRPGLDVAAGAVREDSHQPANAIMDVDRATGTIVPDLP